MTRILIWTLPLMLATTGCTTVDELNDLLPLAVGATWSFAADNDTAWDVEASEGEGHDELPTFIYETILDEVSYERHELYMDDEGWTEHSPTADVPDLYLALPAEDGVTWEEEFVDGTQNIKHWTISYDGREDLTVPAGDFEQAWHVVREKVHTVEDTENRTVSDEWYAPAVGMIRRDLTLSDGSVIVQELTEYSLPEE